MVVVDTSAWIEYFRDGNPATVAKVDRCLERDLIVMGDLIYCEVVQGIRRQRERNEILNLFSALPRYDMLGFHIAGIAAENYRNMRSNGITIRKTIDVIIGTFCVEHGFELVHFDRDFDFMAPHIGLRAI